MTWTLEGQRERGTERHRKREREREKEPRHLPWIPGRSIQLGHSGNTFKDSVFQTNTNSELLLEIVFQK